MENDEQLYLYVMYEIDNNIKNDALWVKAYAMSEGIESKTKPLYIQYRVNFIKEQYKKFGIDYTNLNIDDIKSFANNDFKDDSWIERILSWIDINLNTSSYGTKKIPKTKEEFLNMTNFHVYCNGNVEYIPEEICNLTNLVSIRILKAPSLKELPKSIGNLTKLTELSLSNTLISDLPKEIEKLKNLKTLVIEESPLFNKLPQVIFNLTSLTRLSIGKIPIEELPKEIAMLYNLETLGISNTNITEFPKEISKLYKLKHILLIENNFTQIPEEIYNLSSLEALSICESYIENVSKNISNLTNLKGLVFRNTIFNKLPDEICELDKIDYLIIMNEHLCFTRKQAKWLDSIQKKENCRELHINTPGVYSIFSLSSYEELYSNPFDEEISWETKLDEWLNMVDKDGDVNYCKLESGFLQADESVIILNYCESIMKIPDELKYLKKLKEFSLLGRAKYEKIHTVPLRFLPKEIGSHANLETLRITNSFISELPKEIGNLNNLRLLNLEDNKLTEIPKEIGNLRNLEHLYLSGNNLTELPKEIGNLTNLKTLCIAGNNLIEIPKEIGNLNCLKNLCIETNEQKLERIPNEIKNLDLEEGLDMSYKWYLGK